MVTSLLMKKQKWPKWHMKIKSTYSTSRDPIRYLTNWCREDNQILKQSHNLYYRANKKEEIL